MPPETYDLVLASRHLASVYAGRLETVAIFFSLEWMVTVISTKSFFFGRAKHTSVWRMHWWYTWWHHRKWSEAYFGNRASHCRCCSHRNQPYILVVWLDWDGVAGQRLWGWAGLPSELPLPTVWLGQIIGFPKACVPHLGTIRLCTRGFLVKICKGCGYSMWCTLWHTLQGFFSFLAKRTWGYLSDGRLCPGLSHDCFQAVVTASLSITVIDWLGGMKSSSGQWYVRSSLLGPPGETVYPEGQSDKEKCPLWCRQSFYGAAADPTGGTEIYNQGWGCELWREAGAPLWTTIAAFCSLWISSESCVGALPSQIFCYVAQRCPIQGQTDTNMN